MTRKPGNRPSGGRDGRITLWHVQARLGERQTALGRRARDGLEHALIPHGPDS
jgi:hypothetical protein